MKIEIFTDGACSGNPGKGGFGVLMRIPNSNYEKRFSKGFRKTTNNRMELSPIIFALKQIKNKGHEIHIYTDSRYVSDAITKKWILNWIKKKFKGVKNPDLWIEAIKLINLHHPHFHWIKGHNGHEENEICDELAVKASKALHLEIDEFYESLER